MYLQTQKFLVAGASRSGFAAAKLLLSHGAAVVFVYDERPEGNAAKNLAALEERGAVVVKTAEELDGAREACDVLVLSPGVPIDHALPVAFRKAGKKIIGEMELGALFLRSPVIAVTGTNGKTTTVNMIGEIFRRAGKNAVVCGNVGLPLCDCVETLGAEDVAVVEVSSFQLESLSSLRPHVAVILNVTEDHLDRHYNMENYIFLKKKLLQNSRESEYAVLNADDETVRAFAAETKARVVRFSLREKTDGAWVRDGELFFGEEKILAADELPVGGVHNVADALAAVCTAKLFGISTESVREGLTSFKGVRHRMQKIGEIGGVTYIDDSKATNADATVKALDGTEGETVLLLGGRDKGYEYDALFARIKRGGVAQAVLYGENRFKLLSAAVRQGFRRTCLCPDFDMAVRFAALLAKPGQSVLLSPASASFDEFSGYEERGERFCALFEELSSHEGLQSAAQAERLLPTASAVRESARQDGHPRALRAARQETCAEGAAECAFSADTDTAAEKEGAEEYAFAARNAEETEE